MTTTVDPISFVSTVRPLLAERDSAGLSKLLSSQWTPEQLKRFLCAAESDVRKVAAVCMSLVGDVSAVDPLCDLLADPDAMVNQMAEHALWSIWFRAGTPQANHDLCRGVKALHCKSLDRAVGHFDSAIKAVPTFAEAFNQRAIAHYLADRYDQSIADCRTAVRLVPRHFGSWAGMGHCFLHMDQFSDALRCYDWAVLINPHLDSLRQTAAEIRARF